MLRYYVSDEIQPSGGHEVHIYECPILKSISERTYLGEFDRCQDALTAAQALYNDACGCFFCASRRRAR